MKKGYFEMLTKYWLDALPITHDVEEA